MKRLVLMMFAVAVLATSFGCSEGIKPTATINATDSADQVLFNMTTYVTTQGVLRAKVLADTSYLYNSTQQAEMKNVHVTFYDATGRETSTLTCREGTLHNSQDMEGRGNVVVVRASDDGTLRTEKIAYSQRANQVSSDQPFTFDTPQQHLKGVGFTSDPDFKDLKAQHVTGTGGKFVLPNQ
ncbi:MAG TPA: LPS export ABC transporter periplasmic protein LptC [Gemmatimonadales bacterium]|nr:LPS export ABC transporter periplasmic protein LptC [Gemmatimonadales bacterium]